MKIFKIASTLLFLLHFTTLVGAETPETEAFVEPSQGRPCTLSSAIRIGDFCRDECQFNRNRIQCLKNCCKDNRPKTCPAKETGLSICFRDACEAIGRGNEYGEEVWNSCVTEYNNGKGKIQLESAPLY